MKILIDIKHPAQLNLFKALSAQLKAEGWQVTICYLERGKLPAIIKKEYAGFELVAVGKSYGTKWSILWHGNIMRTFRFLQLIRKNRYNICVAASSIPLALACRLSNTPVIQFYDDPERGKINYLNAKLSDQLFFPPIVKKDTKTSVFNCLKEWSYLSPARFNPDPRVPERYGVKPHDYVFVREVSNKSFNYYNQADGIVSNVSQEIEENANVLLSLEDKTISQKFPPHWILLKEPVEDIHSLIYYSKLVVSSGDSMAREGAMLGVPSIYCGVRRMKANELLMDMKILRHHPEKQMLSPANEIIRQSFDTREQEGIRKRLAESWDDMVQFMMTQVNRYKKA